MATKKAKKRRPKARRPRQTVLPGTEQQFNQAIEEAAADYYDTLIERLALQKTEAEKQGTLAAAMKEAGETVYETADSLIVRRNATEKISCKKKKEKASVESNGEAD